MYKMKYKKPSQFDFDLIIIGSGPGGGVSAHLAAQKNKTVGLIESELVGGDSINFSSIPTRALLKTAKVLNTIKSANAFGVRSTDAHLNYQASLGWRDRAIQSTGVKDESKIFKSEGIKLIKGYARFISPWVVAVGHRHYSARHFIIATGSHCYIPNIPGLKEAGYITFKEITSLTKAPKSIFIIGGGATTYEYTQIFNAFGSKVHIAETKRHILPQEDPEVSDLAESILKKNGAHIYTSAHVLSVTRNPSGTKNVIFEQYGKRYRAIVEIIMVAAGKLPNIDLDLQNANIHFSEHGIAINRYTRTNQKHIYAVGNVNGRTYYANAALQEARIAVHNIYSRKKIAMDYSSIPHCFFGQPEIAVVGKSENDLRLTCQIYQSSITPIGIVGGANINKYDSGFIKILATHTGVVVGASIIAPHASDMMPILTLAVSKKMRACDIAKIVYSFGAWSEAIRVSAGKIKCI